MKQRLKMLKGEIDKFITIVWDFSFPLSVIDRTIGQKIKKDMNSASYQLTGSN